jgi:hypothetical protein
MKTKSLLITTLSAVLLASACAHSPVGTSTKPLPSATVQPTRVSLENTDAAEPSIATGTDGTVYVGWVEHRDKQADVMVQRFDASGKPLGTSARVNPQVGEAKAWRGDPPSLAVGNSGTLYVVWTKTVDSPTGSAVDLYLSHSRDQGATFETPVRINDDKKAVSHGMQSLAVGPDDRIYVAWLDDRNVAPTDPMPAHAAGQHYMSEPNREVFFTVSDNGGRSFQTNKRIATDACPCCSTAISVSPDNRVYVSWRQVLPGDFRHIAVAHSDNAGEEFSQPVIVSDDRWSIGGCPVSGGALSAGANGMLSVLWYTAGNAGPEGLYWAQSTDGGRTFGQRKLVYQGHSQGTPCIVDRSSDQLYAIWEGSDPQGPPSAMLKDLGGGSSSADATPLSTGSSVPVAVLKDDRLYVAYVNTTHEKRNIVFQSATLPSQTAE